MRVLNIHKLKDKLNSLCDLLNKKYNINCGGCCYISYIIAKYLDKLNIEYSLVIFDSRKRNINMIEFEILNRQYSKTSESITGFNTCEHYGIYIKGAGLINSKFYLKSKYRYMINEVQSKQIYWIYKQGLWNNYYDKNNNTTIKEIFKKFFNK